MRNFFVCESGPMGGIQIIFVNDDREACREFVRQRTGELYEYQDKLHIYAHCDEVAEFK